MIGKEFFKRIYSIPANNKKNLYLVTSSHSYVAGEWSKNKLRIVCMPVPCFIMEMNMAQAYRESISL